MKLIDLAHFRKVNNLTQAELANILQLSRAYLSQVETGTNNLSDERIDYLLLDKRWITEGFVPCFDRLQMLFSELIEKRKELFPNQICSSDAVQNFPFSGVLTRPTILLIRHGRSEITEAIADKIVSVFPEVNKEWLITGRGDMFIDETIKNVAETKESLQSFEKKVTEELDFVKKELSEIKQMLGQILETSPNRV